jgi:hypothetical protein
MHREGLFDSHRLDSLLMTADASNTAQKVLVGPGEGYCWYLEVISFTVVGNSHTAAFDVAVTPDNGALPAQATWDHQGLVWTLAAAVRGSENAGSAIFVPPSHFVHFYAAGGTLAQGDVVSVTTQVAVHQLDPHFLTSPEDRAAIRAAHERLAEHQVAEVAIAGRRAV